MRIHRKLIFLAFFVFINANASPENTLPMETKLYGLSKLWSDASYNFAYFDQVPDLDWDSAYLDVSKVDRAINTASRWQVRQSINTKSVEKWRSYEEQLQPFIVALDLERKRFA